MAHGYTGKILHVNLTTRTWSIEEPGEVFYRTYWGGGCLASAYLYKELHQNTDPLGPDNPLIFAASVLVGAPLPGFNRYSVCARSPLSGTFGESEAGGYFGPELKFAGFDALIFRGKADAPVYLAIRRGEVELRDASALWGMENAPLQDAIRAELGDSKIRVASIGPAGERLSPMACILNELTHVNGRGGLGAVMGSKMLKAVAVRGDASSLSFADPALLKEMLHVHHAALKNHMPNVNLGKLGTPMHVMTLQRQGILPTRNWQEGVFEGAEKLGVDGYAKHATGRGTCYRCTVACKREVQLDPAWDYDPRYGGPEFETLGAFGSNCGVDDLSAVIKAHERCNAYGLDTISAGCTISFAMECFERGILTADDAQGRVVRFGDAQGMLWLLERINDQQGIGKILAQGSARAASRIGRGAEACVVVSKKMEPGLHDPRGKTGVGLGFALSPTGGDHIEAPHEVAFQGAAASLLHPLGILSPPEVLGFSPEKIRYFKITQDSWSMNNTLGICNFVVAPIFALSYEHLVQVVKAVSGWNSSLYELLGAGERAVLLARAVNAKLGLGRADDSVAARLCKAMPSGPMKGKTMNADEMNAGIDLYYQMNGLDAQGHPTEATMHRIGLSALLRQAQG
ncbi:MAG: aldehyde ferredoxin oxidoreductase family protein [Desulfovibrionaceae bacterium]